MTGRMISRKAGECSECGRTWAIGAPICFLPGDWERYFCSESCCAEAVKRIVVVPSVQTPSNPQYSAPTANIAVNEATERSRAIHEAHMENMAANARLVLATDQMTTAVAHLTAAINKIAKWLVDDAMANRGLKL
jgi:hypothetical protein